MVCLLLAVFAAFGYFNMEALFIHFFSALLKGLLGYGFWLVPPALLLGAYILAFHRGRPVRLRLTCALLLPLMLAALVHGLLGRQPALGRQPGPDPVGERTGHAVGGRAGWRAGPGAVLLCSAGWAAPSSLHAGILLGLAAFNVPFWMWPTGSSTGPGMNMSMSRRSLRRAGRAGLSGAGAAEALSQTAAAARPSTFRWRTAAGGPGAEPAPEKKRHLFDRRPRVPSRTSC